MKLILTLLTILLFNSLSVMSQVPPPTLQTGEYWTQLFSASYDYQTNGSVRYIVQDPANPQNLCAIIMAIQDSTINSATSTERRVYAAYSSNYGATWEKQQVSTNTSSAEGFPSMTLRNGVPVIAFHTGASTGSFVYEDLGFGLFSFNQLGTIPTSGIIPIWPHIASTSNNNLVLVGAPNPGFQGQFTTYNGSSWSVPAELTNTGGPSGNFSIESGPNGDVSIFGIDYNGTSTADLKWWRSTNNGVSFTAQTIPPYIIDGPDTLYNFIECGRQTVYVGNDPHFIFGVYSNSSVLVGTASSDTTYFIKPRIYHWSPGSGFSIVASANNIPNLADTITTALMSSVCQPTVSRTQNGNLVVGFTAFLKGAKQIVDNGQSLHAGEIFLVSSSNGGTAWSNPVNITNTPGLEEKHPSLIRTPSNDSANIYYVRDMKAGGWVNIIAWGKAPVYGIYKRAGNPIGIKQDIEVVREYTLFQNYPNPFNPATTISYYIPKSGIVSLKVYDITGREVYTLVNGYEVSGAKEIQFNASNLASGIYYYVLKAGDFTDTKKMVLVK